MTNDSPELQSLIERAQKELLSPYQFYSLYQEVQRKTGLKQLYFGEPNLQSVTLEEKMGIQEFRVFLDVLAEYILKLQSAEAHFWVNLSLSQRVADNSNQPTSLANNSLHIEVTLVGEGAIGKVARLRINDREDLAFKVFFDPEFVWQHGPWAEIPIGIHLRYHNVTCNMAEFRFASPNWAVWEWISPTLKPDDRIQGMTYEEFAKVTELTPLNPLNLSNYNLYGIRLDPGGIQKDYWGRRWIDTYQSCVYYLRRFKTEGWSFFRRYLNQKALNYLKLRFLTLLFPRWIALPEEAFKEPNKEC